MKYVIIILTHLCFVELSSAQKFDNQVLYSFKYLSDSLDKKSIKEEVMELLINNDFTFYQAYNKGKRDSIIITNQIDRNRGIPNNIQQTTRYTQYYTICYEDNTFVVKHSFNNLGYEKDYFYYVEEPKNNWQLIDVLDTIGGLKVQKAILKTDSLIWTAYFATEIPIPYGPYTFSGLPGIVVKLNDDRGLFSFDLIEINNNKTSFSNLHVDDFKKVKEISKADFLKSRKFYFENRTLLDIQNKQLFFDDESYKQKLILRDKEYFIKNNVWLENY